MNETRRPPEEVIRGYVDRHGETTVSIEAFEQTWEIKRLGARDRRRIAKALERVGVRVEPPLRRASRRDTLMLSLLAEPEPEPEPEPQPEPEPAPQPEPEPVREPEPEASEAAEPEPSAAETAAADPGPRRRLAGRLAAGALALMVVGSLGPWAKNIFNTDYGLDRDGDLVIGAAAVAAVLLLLYARRRARALPLLAAAAGAAAAGVAAADFRDLVDDSLVGPAWGVYAAFVGSACLVAFSMALLTRRD